MIIMSYVGKDGAFDLGEIVALSRGKKIEIVNLKFSVSDQQCIGWV